VAGRVSLSMYFFTGDLLAGFFDTFATVSSYFKYHRRIVFYHFASNSVTDAYVHTSLKGDDVAPRWYPRPFIRLTSRSLLVLPLPGAHQKLNRQIKM